MLESKWGLMCRHHHRLRKQRRAPFGVGAAQNDFDPIHVIPDEGVETIRLEYVGGTAGTFAGIRFGPSWAIP
jgi:hypothetical protein